MKIDCVHRSEYVHGLLQVYLLLPASAGLVEFVQLALGSGTVPEWYNKLFKVLKRERQQLLFVVLIAI